MITITDAQRNSMQIGEQAIALVRLFYGPEGSNDYIALSSQPLPNAWTENEYRPMLAKGKPPSQSSGSEFSTGKMETGNINLAVSNGEILGSRLSDLVYDPTLGDGDDVGLENRDYEIRLFVEGATTWAGCIAFSKGKIREITHTDTIVTFRLQDQAQIYNNTASPPDEITERDAVGSSVPPDSLGSAKPELYGDLRNKINYYNSSGTGPLVDTLWDPSGIIKVPPMLHIGRDSTAEYWFAAGHICKAPVHAEGDSIWAWDEQWSVLVELAENSWEVYQNTSAGLIIKKTGLTYYDYRLAVSIDEVEGKWDLEQFMIDNNVSTRATVTLDAGDPDATYPGSTVHWGGERLPARTGIQIDVFCSLSPEDSGTTDHRFTIVDEDISYGLGEDGYFTGHVLANLPDAAQDSTEFFFVREFGAPAEETVFEIWAMFMRVTFVDGEHKQLYYGGRGHTADGLSSGTVPTDAAEITKLYAENIGITDIDTAAFTAAASANDVDFAFGVTEKTTIGALLADLGLQSRSLIWWKTTGELTIKVIDRTYSASDFTVNWGDAKSKPKEFQTPLQDIVTQSRVLHGPFGDGFTGLTLQVNDTTARTKHKVDVEQTTENLAADKLADAASAVNLNTSNLRRKENRHIGIEWEGGKKYMPLDIGDVIEFENVPHKIFGLDITQNNNNAATASRTFYKYFMIHKILSRSPEGIKFQCFQLHDLSA